jgi:polar amino acid transport system substrate-binding protein
MVGFEVDLASELGKRLSFGARLVNMDAGDALFDALASRRVDAIVAGLTYYPEITRDVAYSDSYFEAGPVLLARMDRTDIASSRDLGGKRVAVEMGSLGEEEARKLQRQSQGMVVLPMDDVERVLASIGDGSADAAVLDRPAIPPGGLAALGVAPVGPPLRSQPYMIAVQRKNRSLLLAINRELDAMKADGTLAEIEGRWFR